MLGWMDHDEGSYDLPNHVVDRKCRRYGTEWGILMPWVYICKIIMINLQWLVQITKTVTQLSIVCMAFLFIWLFFRGKYLGCR